MCDDKLSDVLLSQSLSVESVMSLEGRSTHPLVG